MHGWKLSLKMFLMDSMMEQAAVYSANDYVLTGAELEALSTPNPPKEEKDEQKLDYLVRLFVGWVSLGTSGATFPGASSCSVLGRPLAGR